MITLRFNFRHPFQGNIILRKLGCSSPWCRTMFYDSAGKHDFDVPLQIAGDGTYKVILNWEFEDRNYSHESIFTVKNGLRQTESVH